jgi:hypothetical protein
MTSRKRASRKPVSRKRASRKPLFRKPVARKRASRKPLFRKIVVCKEDEERNQVTGRCRKKCKDNEERNQNTGRCRKFRSVVASRKPVSKKVASRRKKIVVCKNDEEINQATGRCRKKCKDNEERNEKTGRCRKIRSVASRKPVSKKVASRKPVSKKVASRKPVSKKVTFILPTEEHISPKNVSPKNVSPKNVSPKNVSPKNVSPKNVSPKNVSPKNVSPKNVSPKSNLINTQPNVSNKIISKEMLTRRLSYKNKLNLELKDAENFINKTEEVIKRLRTSGYKKDYVETQLLKMQNTLEKYEDVQDEHMKKKHNEKQEKETKKKDAINNAKKENNAKKHEFQQPTKKEMENQFRYMSKVHQSLPYFMKQNLSKMPNNKGYIWKGVNYYGKLPENPNEPRVLLEKKDDVLITHEYTGTEYRRFEKVGKEKQVLVFASKIK